MKERYYGIDILRFVSMFMVVVIHLVGQGGVRELTIPSELNHQISWLITSVCYCAVDVFALITGFVSIDSKYRLSRGMMLWAQVFFYTSGIFLLYFILTGVADPKLLIFSLFPTLSNHYWYFSSYAFLFILIPFLTRFLNSLSKNNYRLLLFVITLSTLVGCWIPEYFDFSPFKFGNGYSPLWLIFLFIIGGYIKRFFDDFTKINKYAYLAGWCCCVVFVWASRMLISELSVLLFGEEKFETVLYSYLSPLVIFAAVCLLLFFSQLNVKRCKSFISKVSAASFGVFLIHENIIIREKFIIGLFSNYDSSWMALWMEVIIASVAIYLICSIIDYARILLFSFLKIPALADRLAKWVSCKAKDLLIKR